MVGTLAGRCWWWWSCCAIDRRTGEKEKMDRECEDCGRKGDSRHHSNIAVETSVSTIDSNSDDWQTQHACDRETLATNSNHPMYEFTLEIHGVVRILLI